MYRQVSCMPLHAAWCRERMEDAYEDEAFTSEDEAFDGDEADQVSIDAKAPAACFGELSYENEFDDEHMEEAPASSVIGEQDNDMPVSTNAAMEDTKAVNTDEGTQEREHKEEESVADKNDLTLGNGNAIQIASEETHSASGDTVEKQANKQQESASTSEDKGNPTPPSSPAINQISPRLSISVSLLPQEAPNSGGIAAGAVALALAANPNRRAPIDFERLDVTHTPRKSSPFISRLPSVGEITVANMEAGSDSSESSSDEDEPSPRPPPRVFIPQTHRASLESAKSWTNLLLSAVVAPPIARERSKSQPFITRLSSVSEIVVEDTPDDDAAEEAKQTNANESDDSDDESSDDEDSGEATSAPIEAASPTDQGATKTAISAVDHSEEKVEVQESMVDLPLISEAAVEDKSVSSKPLEGPKKSAESEQDECKSFIDEVAEMKPSLNEDKEANPSEDDRDPDMTMKEVKDSDANAETQSAQQDGPHWSRQSSGKSVSETPSDDIEEDRLETEQKNPPTPSKMEVAIKVDPRNDSADYPEEIVSDDSSPPGILIPPPPYEIQDEGNDEDDAQYDDDSIDEAADLTQEVENIEHVAQSAALLPILDGLIDEDADDDDYDYEEQDYEEDESPGSDGEADDLIIQPVDRAQNTQEYEDQEDLYETEEQSRRETELLLLEAEQLIKKQHEDNTQPSPSKEAFYDEDQDIEEENTDDPSTEDIQFTEPSEPSGSTPEERNDFDYEQIQYDGEEECNPENTSRNDDELKNDGDSTEPVSIMENIQSEDTQKTISIEYGSSYDGDEDFTHEDSPGGENKDHSKSQNLEAQESSRIDVGEKPCAQESVQADKTCEVQEKSAVPVHSDQLIAHSEVNEQELRPTKLTTEHSAKQPRSRPSPPSRTITEASPSFSKSNLPRKPAVPVFRSTARVLKTADSTILKHSIKEDELSTAEEVAVAATPASISLPSPEPSSSPPKQAFSPQTTPGGYYTLYVEEQPQLPRKAPVPKQPRSVKKQDSKETKKKLKPVKSPPHLRIELPNTMEKSKRDWLFLNMFRHGDDVSKYEPFVPNAAKSDAKHRAKRPVSATRLVFGTEQTSANAEDAVYNGMAGMRRGRNLVSHDSSLRARERAWVATKPLESTIPAYDSILDKYCATVTSPVIQRQIYQTRQRDLSPQLAYVLERRVEKQWDSGSSESFGAVSTSYKTHIVPLGSHSGKKKG